MNGGRNWSTLAARRFHVAAAAAATAALLPVVVRAAPRVAKGRARG